MFEFSSYLLLSQAEDAVRKNKFSKAAELYRQYLEVYRDRPDRGFVSISLGWVLIRLRNMKEAERLLRDIRNEYSGLEEADIAHVMLRKIKSLKDVDKEISQLLRTIPRYRQSPVRDKLRLRLALAA